MVAFKTAVGGCCCEVDPTPVEIVDCATFQEAFSISGSPAKAAITLEVGLSGITDAGSCASCVSFNDAWLLWSDVATVLSDCIISEAKGTGLSCGGVGLGIIPRFGIGGSGWEFSASLVNGFTAGIFGWLAGDDSAAALAAIDDLYNNGEYTLPYRSTTGSPPCVYTGATCIVRWAPL